MAVNAQDGSRHHSASRARLHDEMQADKKAPEPKPKHEAPPEDADKNVSHMKIHEVVAKHGPASHLHMAHDDGANMHTVTSHHEGGHHHHSEHGSREEAMDHAKVAQGLDGNMAEGMPKDDGEDTMAGIGADDGGGGIPGMADY